LLLDYYFPCNKIFTVVPEKQLDLFSIGSIIIHTSIVLQIDTYYRFLLVPTLLNPYKNLDATIKDPAPMFLPAILTIADSHIWFISGYDVVFRRCSL
jgi:hypothetical protein